MISCSKSPPRLASLTRPNGVTDSMGYNAIDALTALQSVHGASTVQSLNYGYDPGGRRTSHSDGSGTTTYGYDALGELLSASHGAGASNNEQYTYDALGNRLTSGGSPVTATYNANNQRTGNGGTTSYTYDNEGDLLQTTVTGSGTTTNTWSADHHLTQVTHSDNTTTTYSYDPFGRLVAENDRGTVTRWVWDGANQRLQYDGNNALTASYVTGRGPSSLLEMTRGGQTSYYLRDGANNVTALTDPSGVLAASYNYDTFGNVLSMTGSVANPFTFASALSDPGTGGYQMRARSYDPTTGRFLSEDPIGHVNAYSYVKNDPADYVDPSGMDAVEYSMQVSSDTGVELEAAQAAAEEETAEISELENALSDVTSDASSPADAAETEGDHIVLGKSIGLDERAAQIGGRHLMNDPNWQDTLMRAVADPSTKFSVALDDVEGGSAYSRVMSAVQRAASGRGTPFDWEVQQLFEGGRLPTTDFWEGGSIVGNPF